MRRRGGLGRGLDALIPSSPQETASRRRSQLTKSRSTAEEVEDSSGPTFEQLLIDRIDPNPRQPRGAFDEEPLQELTASIEAVGVLQPIVVRPNGERYQIVMGERRVRAAKTRRARADPRDRPNHRGRSAPSGRAAREHPPRGSEPARGSGRVRAAPGRLWDYPRRAGGSSGTESARDRQRDAASAAARERSAPDRGQDAVGRSRSCGCLVGGSRSAGTTRRPDCGRGADGSDGRGARPADQERGTAARTRRAGPCPGATSDAGTGHGGPG